MSEIELSDEMAREFVAEFGDDAPRVAEHALRGEITRHRIERAVVDGTDPADAVADVLARDPDFADDVRRLASSGPRPAGNLEDRLRRETG